MIPRIVIDTAEIPGGGGTLRLIGRGAEYSIMLGGNELMNSRLGGSEEALATLSCARIGSRAGSRILIGGLGMGFTLRAALGALGPDALVDVAELVPAVVAWARGPLAHVFAGSLDDPRVTTLTGDVGEPIRANEDRYDAILLDVDNGPDGLTRSGNDRLYAPAGLRAAWRALRPGGVLAVWSAGADAGFTRRLREGGFTVEEVVIRGDRGRSGPRHVIWLAEKRTAARQS